MNEANPLESAKKAFERIKPDLVINRVPENSLKQFKELAESDFKDGTGFAHYGFLLKALLDAYFSIPKTTELEARIVALEEEVTELKKAPIKKKEIRLGGGRVVNIG